MRALLALMLPLALAACRDDRDAPRDAVPAAVGGSGNARSLPSPEAAPGSSVTGMPTSPPPASAAPAEAVADAPPEPVPVDEILPDEAATAAIAAPAIDPTAPLPQPSPALPPPAPADAAAAGSLVTQYMAALGAGAPAKAQMLWSTTPNDSQVLQLSRNAPFAVGVGTATADAGGRITVPVDVRGRADDGSDRHLTAVYTVQRGPAGNWRIMSATVRDAAP